MKKLFFKLGFIPKDDMTKLQTELSKLQTELDDLKNPKESKLIPTMSYDEYCKLNNLKEEKFKHTTNHWDIYWQDCYSAKYISFCMSIISKYPELLKEFLYQFSMIDWNGIEKYMKDVKWYWRDNKITPTIKDLQENVISLLQSILDHDFNGISGDCTSGGFCVTLKNKTEIKIEFNKEDVLLID